MSVSDPDLLAGFGGGPIARLLYQPNNSVLIL
jgi:hypothetical protein